MATLGAAACNGKSSAAGAAAGGAGHGPLEQTHLRIGMPKGELGALPIFTGVDKGYFKDQGIDVTVDDSYASYQDTLKALGDGKVDLVYDDYAHAILAQSKGNYRLQLVAEGYNAGDGSVELLSKPTNTRSEDQVRTVFKASQGFLVPMAGTGDPSTDFTVPTVMLMTRLPDIANSMKLKIDDSGTEAQAHLKTMAVGAIGEKLTGVLDANVAAVLPEPYFSSTSTTDKVVKLLDLTRGSTQAMPMGGYFAKQDFAVSDTNLFKAFTTALNQAKTVTSQRAAAMAELQAHYGTIATATVSASISFGTFPTTVSVDRVTRVLTLMQDLNLASFFNIDTMMPPDALRGQG
ncbi:ABC transporter substrate-binding protein [Catenulispora subtropica]|uniref:SsuA/THI5-like domain-containing protein n=1 Tax=Catenulispora subtropica TaxID=450798 RepID=A0ABP5E6Q7_9ACTN